MKYKCVNSFTVDYYNEAGMVTEDRIEISRGSIWERDDETDIIGAEYILIIRKQWNGWKYQKRI